MHKWQHNYEQFIKSEQPIAQINACHSSLEAKKMPCDEMSGLHPTIYLAKGAKVMLTMTMLVCAMVQLEASLISFVRMDTIHQIYQ
jgi:hypothetical protein